MTSDENSHSRLGKFTTTNALKCQISVVRCDNDRVMVFGDLLERLCLVNLFALNYVAMIMNGVIT